jgi:HTH-type transcriptional regulator/antitoxin HigA
MTAIEEDRYAELLRAEAPRVIKTEADNERALRRVEALLDLGDAITEPESELLELLAFLIEQFEEEHYSLASSTPAELLRELMAVHGMKRADIVPLFPSKGVASEVLSGKRDVSKSQAQRLGEFFGLPAAFFLDL